MSNFYNNFWHKINMLCKFENNSQNQSWVEFKKYHNGRREFLANFTPRKVFGGVIMLKKHSDYTSFLKKIDKSNLTHSQKTGLNDYIFFVEMLETWGIKKHLINKGLEDNDFLEDCYLEEYTSFEKEEELKKIDQSNLTPTQKILIDLYISCLKSNYPKSTNSISLKKIFWMQDNYNKDFGDG
jgi:hypothetical protein